MIARLRWIDHEHNQRIRTCVHDWNQVVQRLDGENLSLVEHFDVGGVQTSAETVLSGAEHDAAAIGETDLLLSVRAAHGLHVFGKLRIAG